jgi:CRP-like cAMP-binding protein
VSETLKSRPEQDHLIRKIESIVDLSAEDRQALLELPITVRNVEADKDIVRERDQPTECVLVLEGFVCRYKLISDGKRQIMGFYVPGDIPDLHSLYIEVMDHSLGTLTATKIAGIPHDSLRTLLRRRPSLAEAFWRDTLIDAAVFREWIIGLGRRDAYARIAHLFCELFIRHRAVGLTTGDSFDLHVTQAELGDALGLSTVHVNRVLQDLRRDNLITLRGKLLTILDWNELQRAGEFDPLYLHSKCGTLAE